MTKASIVVMSHLSDAQEEINMGYANKGIIHNLNFVKYIILQTGGDLTKEIDPDVMYDEFNDKQK
jgi:hypothetical protein